MFLDKFSVAFIPYLLPRVKDHKWFNQIIFFSFFIMKSSPLFGPSNEKHLLDQIRQHPVVLPKYPKYLKESTYTGNYQEMPLRPGSSGEGLGWVYGRF